MPILSGFSWNEEGHSISFVEQRTRLNAKADFTDDVSAFIELDSYDIWGEDFRSNYITAGDARAATADDVEVYQAYIDVKNMYDTPLSLRIGRQELSLGSEWLVGVNDSSSIFTGLSFDAIKLTYETDLASVAAFWAKLAERSPIEEDGDVDLYGIYASYLGLEDIVIDAYWMYVRDAIAWQDTGPATTLGGLVGQWFEEVFGVDSYDTVTLHTFGLRGAGTMGALDFESELAFQTGDAGRIGSLFAPVLYGDDDADFSAWGANLEVGYTFDTTWQPRVFIGGAYFDGEDNRDISFVDWVAAQVWPWYDPDASISFNRLFSNWEYSEFLANTDLSNCWLIRGGVEAMPTEKLELLLSLAYYSAVDEFEAPPHFTLLGRRIPLDPRVVVLEPLQRRRAWLGVGSLRDV